MDLAIRFNGEIINGDAVQMYDGLPIITNKITKEEQKGIPHHLLGSIGLNEETWRVGLFKKKAGQVIQQIRSRGRLPILVGGTHYYTQSLLFEDTLVTDQIDGEDQVQTELSNLKISERFPILDGPTETIIERLKEVDPIMADRWHPKDRRKIQRSLEIFLLTGKKASDIYNEQKAKKNQKIHTSDVSEEGHSESASDPGSPLLFWVHSESESLKKRLDMRVDKMMKSGLLDEVKSMDAFLQDQAQAQIDVDRSRGIWVSIGYKEFEQYLAALKLGTESQKRLDELLAFSIEQTQAATRQYAKRQTRWIRLKLIPSLSNQNLLDRLYLLDGTDLTSWARTVSNAASNIAGKFLSGETLPTPSELSDVAKQLLTPERTYEFSDRSDLWIRRECETCHTIVVTEEQWQSHIKSRTHRRLTKKKASNGRWVFPDNHGKQVPSDGS